MLSVATVTDATTPPHLQAAVDALEAFRGESWTVDHVSLMKRSLAGADSTAYQRIPLGLH